MSEHDDVYPREIIGHGAYLCLRVRDGQAREALAALPVPAVADRLGLANEYQAPGPSAGGSVAYLRRMTATRGDIADDGVLQADAIVHVAARDGAPVDELCAELTRLASGTATIRALRGVVRPKSYTSATINSFAYAHAVTQRPGPDMPNAFLVPMSKTASWWAKGWMERHTYFLPRYDEDGRMVNEGHTLASAAGVPCLLRRTYKHLHE